MPRSASRPRAARDAAARAAAARVAALAGQRPALGPAPPAVDGWVPLPGPAGSEESLDADRAAPHGRLPEAEGAGAASGIAQRLRAGRFDPGAQGAAVLVGVALLAGALSAWFLLGSRPAVVPAPPPGTTVESPGAAQAGAGSPVGGAAASGATASGATASGATASGATAPATEVVIAVAGTVARPGVVRLPAGSRVVDAVEAAGGVLPGADAGLLNLARVLTDGEQVLVGVEAPPTAAGGPGAGSGGQGSVTTADGRLDLNRAGVPDLDQLPGVGPVLAQRIVEHRDAVGGFTGVEQLAEVPGIGDSRYAELEPLVAVP